MTAQEKWAATIRYMQLVRANYVALKRRSGPKMGSRQRLGVQRKWFETIERVYARLRCREGKSAARAKHDQLVARTIEMMVFDQMRISDMRTQLTVRRTHTKEYIDRLAEEAILEIEAQAERDGLIG